MSIDQNLSAHFKPEERKRGEDLFRKDVVFLSGASDTGVKASIKASSPCRITLSTANIASPSFSAECTCPASRKGRLCKHIWAVLLKLEEQGHDFLENKSRIEESQRTQPAKPQRRETRHTPSIYPAEVEQARLYFQQNGFPLEPLDTGELMNAKKLLSRVFHPDKGGTHEETVTLNRNFDVIYTYLTS